MGRFHLTGVLLLNAGVPAADTAVHVRLLCWRCNPQILSAFLQTDSPPPVQEEGLDTVDANRALGLPDDCREYTSVRNILADLGVRSIRLMVRPQGSSLGFRVWSIICQAASGRLSRNLRGPV